MHAAITIAIHISVVLESHCLRSRNEILGSLKGLGGQNETWGDETFRRGASERHLREGPYLHTLAFRHVHFHYRCNLAEARFVTV